MQLFFKLQQCMVSMKQALTLHARAKPKLGKNPTFEAAQLGMPAAAATPSPPARPALLPLPSLPRTAAATPSGAGARCSKADCCITCAHRICIMASLGDASGSLVKTVNTAAATALRGNHALTSLLMASGRCSVLRVRVDKFACCMLGYACTARRRARQLPQARKFRAQHAHFAAHSIHRCYQRLPRTQRHSVSGKTPLARDIMPAQN